MAENKRTMALISIAMTTYNGEKYIREQIDSILNQSYSDIELVICDDSSKDSTREILKEYEKKDSRVKLFFNEQNLGFKKNFEKAISLCNGEYVALSDQDDVWELTKLEDSLKVFEKENVKMTSTNSLFTDENLNSLNRTMKDNLGILNIPQGKNDLVKHLIHHNFVQGSTILAKRDFINSCLPIPEAVVYHDWWFGLKAASEDSFVYTDKVTLKYRQHNSNVTDNSASEYNKKIRPVEYKRAEVEKYTQQAMLFLQIVSERKSDRQMEKYLNDTKKYYESFVEKKLYTIVYICKYYEYMLWKSGIIHKWIYVTKRLLGLIKFHVFTKQLIRVENE